MYRRTAKLRRACACSVMATFLAGLFGWPVASACRAQGSISNLSWVPFVTGIVPVVGRNGTVGGVRIEPGGVVRRSTVDETSRLRADWLNALRPVSRALNTKSPLRKVSLRRLSAAITRELKPGKGKGKGLPDEMLFLAGLQRVQLVLVYPDENDILLAGPAEGWTADAQGELVGVSSGRPVLHLEDLLEALRTAENAAEGDGISCSIDPTPEGLANYQRAMATGRLRASPEAVKRLERAIGPYDVQIRGVAKTSHFARVMLAADYMMKRLAMNLEESPVDGLPSYLELLETEPSVRHSSSPRWWLAADYEPLRTSEDGLAWELRGPGLKALTAEEVRDAEGNPITADAINPLAQRWAESMTARYDALSLKLPVFGQVRNCMDLAVVAALLVDQDLAGISECDLTLLMEPKRLVGGTYEAPQTLAAQASFVKAGGNWIVSVSGGVSMDSWSVLEQTVLAPDLERTHAAASPRNSGMGDAWWWD